MSTYSVRYVHKVSPRDTDVGPAVEIPAGAFADRNKLGKALRALGVMMKGCRVSGFRVERDKVVVFPVCPGLSTYWHAIILEVQS